jgi:hypothetical protein
MLKSSVPKSSNFFECEFCHYTTSKKSQYSRHLLTAKHKNNEKATDPQHLATFSNKKSSTGYMCSCNKIYKDRTGLWRHQKVCDYKPDHLPVMDKDIIMKLLQDNTELKSMLIEQQNMMMKVIENGTNNTTTTTHTNSHNKAFNLNFFLNETCKHAMNITDFIDSIKLQLSDLINIGDTGYVEGISKIIVKNLNALDETKRPVHCTDKKREIIYIKDENIWTKEDENKTKLKKAIRTVANKNIRLLPQFREKHPDYGNSESVVSDKYSKMVIEAMGGAGNNDTEKEEKIIRNISKATTIDKSI